MSRLSAIFVALSLGACGGKGFGSICDQIPAPAVCMQACDSQPGAPNTCPAGYHCSPDGKCDAQCTVGGGQCGDGYLCTPDGTCESTGNAGDAGPDSACPAVHFTPTKTTPSIELVLDRSGSMGDPNNNINGVSRYEVLHQALTGAMGAVTTAQAGVYFGAALFAGNQAPCLNLDGYTAPRALNNASVINQLIVDKPAGTRGSTPTADALTLVTADFATNPPPPGSPPIILLATDGAPNSCDGNGGTGPSIDATKAAYTAGIRTFIIGLAGLNEQYLQDIANAGTGSATGQTPNCPTCAPYYTADDTDSLVNAFNTIINGVLSCDLAISGMVDPATASSGIVTLNGMTLTYGTDWTIDPNGRLIHLIGNACTILKTTSNPVVDAAFACGSVLL